MIEAMERVTMQMCRIDDYMRATITQFEIMWQRLILLHRMIILARRFRLLDRLLWLHIPKPWALEIVARWPERLLPRDYDDKYLDA